LADLGLSQIYPVWDEDTSDERVAVSASFVDPYLVIIRDDASVLLLQADESGDLDEAPLPDEISQSQWRSCCLYHDKTQAFNFTADPSSETRSGSEVLLFLLNSECKLSVGFVEKRKHSEYLNL
jgi:cleavage and polyadenylation specificity factor subunit 1